MRPTYRPARPGSVQGVDAVNPKQTVGLLRSAASRVLGTVRLPQGARRPAGPEFRPGIVSLIPKDSEVFRNVFERDPAQDELGAARDLADRFGSIQGRNLDAVGDGPERLRDSFREAAAAGKTAVIVVAHSVGRPGGVRRVALPNGSKVSVEQLHEWAAAEGLQCRVMTCHGRDFGVNEPLALRHAYEVVKWATEAVVLPAPRETGGRAGKADGTDAATADGWDARAATGRDAGGFSDVVLIGATPDDAGGLLLWESVGRRPFWLAAAAWLVLAAGVLANALLMLWRRRQEPGVPKSLDLMEAWIAATLRRLRRLRAATRFAIPLTLAVAALATELIRRERWHEAAAGRATVASLVNVPATAGVALVLLAALAVRVDAERSQAGRLILATSGGVAGATYGAGGALMFYGVVGLGAVLWVNLLHIAACACNGPSRLPGLVFETVRWWGILGGGAAGAAALYGLYRGSVAGYRDVPVLLALRAGLGRPPGRAPEPEGPGTVRPSPLRRTLGADPFVLWLYIVVGGAWLFLFGAGAAILEIGRLLHGEGVDWNAVWWTAVAGGVLAGGFGVFFAAECWPPTRADEIATSTPGATPTGVVESRTTPRTGQAALGVSLPEFPHPDDEPAGPESLPLRFRMARAPSGEPDADAELPKPWEKVLSWVAPLMLVFTASGIYVGYLVQSPQFPPGARVTLVRDRTEEKPGPVEKEGVLGLIEEIEKLFKIDEPPTVAVFQAPAELAMPRDLLRRSPVVSDAEMLSLANKSAIASIGSPEEARQWEALMEKRREGRRLQTLRGPSGVVFAFGIAPGQEAVTGEVDGVVVEGSSAVVVADDQGSDPERGVLIRLVRDPDLGADSGAVVVVRWSNLRAVGPQWDGRLP